MKSTILNTLYAIIIALLCLILPQAKALAATYYVDIDGVGQDGVSGTGDDVVSSDNNPGTADEPWRTLARAYTWYSGEGTKVQEGDTVLFRNGDYGEFREIHITANRANWIIYAADGGHSPTLDSIFVYNDNYDSYLRWNGFNVKDGISLQYSSYFYIYDCNITSTLLPIEGFYAPYVDGDKVGIAARYNVHQVTVENCEISYTTRGIRCGQNGGDYWTIKNNTIHRYTEDAIRPEGANHLLIEGNRIYDTNPYRTGFGLVGTGSGAFEVGETVIQTGTNAEGVVYELFTANKIGVYTTTEAVFQKAPTGGTVTGQTSGATMSNITKCDYSHSDGIQVAGSTPMTDVVIRGNIMNPGMSNCLMFTPYGFGTNWTIENNLAWGQAGNDIQIGGVTSGLKICNNTFMSGVRLTHGSSGESGGSGLPSITDAFYNNITESLTISEDIGELYIRVLNHGNNIFGTDPNGAGGPLYPFEVNETELVDVDIDALFVNAEINDYTLAPDSLAIDFGDADYGPATDILGNPRDALSDAGCYEYGASTLLYGDVNSDGEVTAFDAALAAHIAVDLAHPDIKNPSAAEVSGDGEVSAYDAALIAQRAVGLIEKFPVEL